MKKGETKGRTYQLSFPFLKQTERYDCSFFLNEKGRDQGEDDWHRGARLLFHPMATNELYINWTDVISYFLGLIVVTHMVLPISKYKIFCIIVEDVL